MLKIVLLNKTLPQSISSSQQ